MSFFNNQPTHSNNFLKDLGLIVSTDFIWSEHINKKLLSSKKSFQFKSSQVFMTIRQCLLFSFQMFFSYLRSNSYMYFPVAFQGLSSFHLNSSMVLLCTVSCGRLFQSRGALIVKKIFRISSFALRLSTFLFYKMFYSTSHSFFFELMFINTCVHQHSFFC